jgi:hypothetical protein
MTVVKMYFKIISLVLLMGVVAMNLSSCSNDEAIAIANNDSGISDNIDDTDFVTTDWTIETHSKDVDPNYSEVFNDMAIKRLDIVITEERWQSMLDNMTELYGVFNSGGGGPGGAGGPSADVDEDPIFVPGEVFYNGKQWYRTGIRFKGNSSLRTSWHSGILKLSLKLDFDEFEDDYPQIDNQRFYGFKKLHLKSNYKDKSMVREKVAGDVFRNAGLAASHTAFYTVYLDHGDGPIYFGVYTMVEDVEDTLLKDYFKDDDGNLYKPDGNAASFAANSFKEDEYVKKNNENEANFSDVNSLLTIINDNGRISDPTTWRANLDAVFDTDVFLKYLAANTVLQNWDTYGKMTHNYYLYNNPKTNKLTWIPWDNNEALQDGLMGGSLPFDFSGLNDAEWPLIGYLYQDATYKATYDNYVQEIIEGPFGVSNIQSQYDAYSSMISTDATSELMGYSFLNSSSEFQAALNQLNTHVSERTNAANAYLN